MGARRGPIDAPRRGRIGALTLAIGALVALGASTAAGQTPDTTGFAVAVDSARAVGAAPPSDTTRAEPTAVALAAPHAPPWGRAVTPTYALTAELAPEALLADRPEAFEYATGTPGRSGGVSVFGLAPDAAALTLDGRALDDLFTSAPRLDLLPAEALGPMRGGGAGGAPVALSAEVRPFRLGRPITELRTQTGQEGVQHASATHAQTRRAPGAVRAVLGAPARTTVTAHAATRGATGPTAGGQTRHSHALVRLVAAAPRRAVEVGGLYADHLDGARRGVTAVPFDAVFDPLQAAVIDASATRRTLRAELWATARAPVFGDAPLGVTASVVGQRLRYSPDGVDTLAASTGRVALAAEQAVRVGGHRVAMRASVAREGDPSGGADVFGDGSARILLDATGLDSLSLGAWTVTAQPGVHAVDARVWPSLSLGVARGALRLGVRAGARAPSRLAERGLPAARPISADPSDALERTVRAHAAVALSRGALRLDVGAWGARTTDAQRLVARGDTAFAFARLPDALTTLGGTLGLAARDASTAGFYGRAAVTAATTLDADASPLARRDADALPALRADLRVGTRARDVGDGVLDLDAGVRVSAWTAFRSRLVEPATGALALPDPTSALLGLELPARGTVGVDVTATFVERAVVFVRYDHALGSRLYDGAIVTQGEPLAATALRFGVFWALLD